MSTQPTNEMTLSEAIKQGARIRPQSFGGEVVREIGPGGEEFRTCALGAAYEAAGGTFGHFDASGVIGYVVLPTQAVQQWPVLNQYIDQGQSPCDCKEWSAYLRDTIIHLNDDHGWPRERIAKWVAFRERK